MGPKGSVRGFVFLGLVAIGLLAGGCARDPQVAKAKFYERGQQYLKGEKYREAAIEFRNAIKIDPRYADAQYGLGLSQVRLGRMREAFQAFRAALDADPGKLEARLELAELLLLARQTAQARMELGEVQAADPANARAQITLAKSYLLDKEFRRASEEFEKAKPLAPGNAAVWSAAGMAKVGDGKYAQAEKDFRRAIELDPTSGEAYRNLAQLLAITRGRNDVEDLLWRALEAHPRSLELHLALGDFYFQQGRVGEVEQLFARLKSQGPDSSPLRQELGDFWVWRNELPRAIAEYEALRARDPDPVVQKKLISAYLTLGRLTEAERLLEALGKEEADALDTRAFRAALAYRRQQFAFAAQELQAVAKEDPTSLFARYYLGLSWLALSNVEQAKTAFLDCVRLNEKFPDAYLKLAELALRKQDGEVATGYAQKALGLNPRSLDAYLLLAQAYLLRGNLRGADAVLEEARKLPSPPAEVFELGARLAALKKDDAGAIAQYEQALARTTRPLLTLTRYSGFLMERGRPVAAIERVKKWIESAPPQPEYYELLAGLYLQQRDLTSALAAAQQAQQLGPERWAPHLLLGRIYQQQGQLERALAEYDEVIRRHPAELSSYLLAGNLLTGQGNYERAKPYFEGALRQSPGSSQAQHALARWYAERGENLEVALSLAQEVKKQSPKDPYVSDTLGWIYSQKGVYQMALEELRPAARSLENDAVVHYHLGMTYYRMGQRLQARRALERALKLGLAPSSLAVTAERTLRDLASS